MSNYNHMKSLSLKSLNSPEFISKSNRFGSVGDYGLRKLLNDPKISESDRLHQVR